MKLKYSQIKSYREQQLTQQFNCCSLCGQAITDDAVLDHDHRSGLIRKVLHRGCNALLGKIENNMARNKVDIVRLKQLTANLIDYITTQHTEILHPTHKTPEEKKHARKKSSNNKKRKSRSRVSLGD